MERMQHGLSKRQRQIIEAIYALKEATVAEVRRAMPDPPSYSAVRTTMNILEDRGLLDHTLKGRTYCYFPTIPHHKARQCALQRLLRTYFDNSIEKAVAALVKADPKGLTEDEYRNLLAIIEKAKKRK